VDFGTILIVISIVAALVAAAAYWGSGRIYSGLGREGGLDMPRDPPAREGSAEAQGDLRQMLEAKSTRRQGRGEEPLDVDAELASLTRGAASRDAALRDEVRQLVIARNERRSRRGQEPLDVEAELERQLRSSEG
jgi:hypothetical protein